MINMTNFVTLKAIKNHSPCLDGWQKLLKHLGKTKSDNKPLSLITILDSNGLDDALWCLRALPPEMDGKIRLFNCLIAERALKYWEAVYPDDKRPHEAIAVARRYVIGNADDATLNAARAAARDSARAAWAASDAARSAWDSAWAAGAAGAAGAAAWAAAGAAWAARAAAGAADRAAAGAAARAAWDAEIKAQEQLFREYWA